MSAPPLPLASLARLLGTPADDPALDAALATLFPAVASREFETKPYPDATFRNYYTLGLSLGFVLSPQGNSAEQGTLVLDTIDIFNTPPVARAISSSSISRKAVHRYSPLPPLELRFANTELVFPPRKVGGESLRVPRDEICKLGADTTGREIVRRLGEPTRKGSGGWVGVWLEWGRVELRVPDNGGVLGEEVETGIMLELKDPKGAEKVSAEQQKSGMGGLWERAAFWPWGGIKLFRPAPV